MPKGVGNWGSSEELDKALTQGGDAPAAAAATTEPAAAPPPAAATKPQGAGDTAPAAPAKSDAPAAAKPPESATSAEIRKWKVTGKVAGADKDWEIGEDALDGRNAEKSKWLRDQLQKAEDYDRPGGALDQAASKKAIETHANYMLANGLWVRGVDGKLIEAPQVKAYREWREAQAKPAAAPAAATPPAPAAPAEQKLTPAQARIAELTAVFEKDGGFTAAEMREYQELIADERHEQREAKRLAEQQAQQQKQAQATAATQQEENLRQAAVTRIKTFVQSISDRFKDPETGEVDARALRAAEAVMSSEAIETQDWAKAETAAREYAEGHAAKLKGLVAKIPKQATAPPPAPVHRGGTAAGADEEKGANGKNGKFDPKKPFSKQGSDELTRYLQATAENAG